MDEERELSEDRILASQIEAVRNFTPEEILAPEKRAQIVEAVTNGLDTIASTIKEKAEAMDVSLKEVTPLMLWTIEDFTRSALTVPPLPSQATAFGEPFELEEPTPEAKVADEHNWWKELSEEQKVVLWRILEEDFGIDEAGRREEVAEF